MRSKFFVFVFLLGVGLYLFASYRIYKIDGTSMNYGLVEGDIVLSKRRIDTIARGDLLVIRHPLDPKGRLYIKRCAALPGDRFFEKARSFYLQLKGDSEYTRRFAIGHRLTVVKTPHGYFIKEPYRRYYGVVHDWGLLVPKELERLPLQTVPQGHYLMLGDFRDNSADSRFFGAVPRKWIVSKVFLILKKPHSWEYLLDIKEAD